MPARSTVDSGSDAPGRRSPRAARRRPSRPARTTAGAPPRSARSAAARRRPARPRRAGRRARGVVPAVTDLDEAAEQPRPGQRGERGERVQAEHPRQRPAVLAQQPPARGRAPDAIVATGSVRGWTARWSRSCASSPRDDRVAVGRDGGRAARGGCRSATTRPSCEEHDLVGLVEQQRAGVMTTVVRPAPVLRAAARRSAPRCARRPRWSARPAPASRRRPAAPGPARAAAAGRRRTTGRAPRPRRPARGQRVEDVVAAGDRAATARIASSSCVAAAGRARRAATPVNSRGSVSLTTTRRRTAGSGRSASGTPSER